MSLVFALLITSNTSRAGNILLDDITTGFAVYAGGNFELLPVSTTLPENNTVEALINAGGQIRSNTTSYMGTTNSLRLDVNHQIISQRNFPFVSLEGRTDTSGLGMVGDAFWFTVEKDVDYVMEGVWEVTNDSSDTIEAARLFTYLIDQTDATVLLFYDGYSQDVPDASFTFGGEAGNSSNAYFEGSTSGTLLAGHNYRLDYQFLVDDLPGVDGTTAANGFVDFRIVPPCEGDFDTESDVDGTDIAVFAADFGRTDCVTGAPCEGDFEPDGDVDDSDLAIFAEDFGRTDCQ